MKDLKEFEYYLWLTEENGVKHYWTRLKATGESCEVTHDVMKYLRSEEKKFRRGLVTEAEEQSGNMSYDAKPVEDFESNWLEDKTPFEDDILTNMAMDELVKQFTPNQLEVYQTVLMGDRGIREYARIHGRDPKSIYETIKAIRKKYKKYFS